MTTNPEIAEEEVDTLMAQFNGNARATIKALMHDLALMAEAYNADVPRGFRRRATSMTVSWGRGAQGISHR